METTVPPTSALGASSSSNLNSNNTTSNPPSIELAYKKKCIQLKKRLNEIEAENDIMRARNRRAKAYIQKMRLETCIMLERLATLTGMLDEHSNVAEGKLPSAELRAKAAAIIGDARARSGQDEMMDDETEGSSEEQPPTPQERPLRVKRSRRSNLPIDELEAEATMQFETASPDKTGNNNNNSNDNNDNNDEDNNNNNNSTAVDSDAGNSGLPNLAPALSGASQDQLTSSFRVVNSKNGSSNHHDSGTEAPVPMDVDEQVLKSES